MTFKSWRSRKINGRMLHLAGAEWWPTLVLRRRTWSRLRPQLLGMLGAWYRIVVDALSVMTESIVLSCDRNRKPAALKNCPLMHLIHTNQRPAYMAEMIELTAASSSRSGLRSAPVSASDSFITFCTLISIYRKPALKTKIGERAFSHAGPAAWNSLLDHIQSESNAKNFKKLLNWIELKFVIKAHI